MNDAAAMFDELQDLMEGKEHYFLIADESGNHILGIIQRFLWLVACPVQAWQVTFSNPPTGVYNVDLFVLILPKSTVTFERFKMLLRMVGYPHEPTEKTDLVAMANNAAAVTAFVMMLEGSNPITDSAMN